MIPVWLKKIHNRLLPSKKGIVCLVGESGSGKTTLATQLEELGFTSIDSYTTRTKRFPQESGHIFVTKTEFQALLPKMAAYTTFNGHLYGATYEQIYKHDLYIIDVNGLEMLIDNIGRENVYVVYISVDRNKRLYRMHKERGIAAANARIEHDDVVFSNFSDYDILLPNNFSNDLERNVETMRAILTYKRRKWR